MQIMRHFKALIHNNPENCIGKPKTRKDGSVTGDTISTYKHKTMNKCRMQIYRSILRLSEKSSIFNARCALSVMPDN
jgi:hypothetical protein